MVKKKEYDTISEMLGISEMEFIKKMEEAWRFLMDLLNEEYVDEAVEKLEVWLNVSDETERKLRYVALFKLIEAGSAGMLAYKVLVSVMNRLYMEIVTPTEMMYGAMMEFWKKESMEKANKLMKDSDKEVV